MYGVVIIGLGCETVPHLKLKEKIQAMTSKPVVSLVAAGCQAVIFTTDRGTPTGNAIVPVLKVTANGRTYQKMEDNMDVDLSAIVRGEKTYQEMGKELVDKIKDICNGKMTKAEAFGFSDIAVDHVCRFV